MAEKMSLKRDAGFQINQMNGEEAAQNIIGSGKMAKNNNNNSNSNHNIIFMNQFRLYHIHILTLVRSPHFEIYYFIRYFKIVFTLYEYLPGHVVHVLYHITCFTGLHSAALLC